MVNKEMLASVVGTSVAAVSTALQTDEVLQYVQLIITIAAAAVTFLTGIISLIIRIRNWYRKAKADGKITEEELDEGFSILQQGLDEGKTNLDKIKDASQKGKK